MREKYYYLGPDDDWIVITAESLIDAYEKYKKLYEAVKDGDILITVEGGGSYDMFPLQGKFHLPITFPTLQQFLAEVSIRKPCLQCGSQFVIGINGGECLCGLKAKTGLQLI